MTTNSPLPILMVADSSLLYIRKPSGRTWLNEVITTILSSNQITASKCVSFESLTSCYIGVNNGDEEAFFEIFQGYSFVLFFLLRSAIAAAGFDSKKCHFIKSSFTSSEIEVLSRADLIFISGS